MSCIKYFKLCYSIKYKMHVWQRASLFLNTMMFACEVFKKYAPIGIDHKRRENCLLYWIDKKIWWIIWSLDACWMMMFECSDLFVLMLFNHLDASGYGALCLIQGVGIQWRKNKVFARWNFVIAFSLLFMTQCVFRQTHRHYCLWSM